MAGEILNHLTPDVLSAMVQTAKFHAETLPMFSMGDVQSDPKKFLGAGLKIASVATLAIGLVGGGIKSYDTVPENHEGLRSKGGRLRAKTPADGREWTRKKPGELYGHVPPGPHVHLPWLGAIKQVSTEDYTSEIDTFHVVDEGDGKDAVKVKVTWGVMPRNGANLPKDVSYPELLYRAIVGANSRQEMAEGVVAICGEPIRHFMNEQTDPRAVKGEEVLKALAKARGDELLSKYCVEVRGVNVGDVAPTEATTLASARKAAHEPISEIELLNWGEAAVAIPNLHIVHPS